MQPTISAFYQCYKQPKAFLHALTAFRQHYPDSTIVLISDGGGYDYTQAAAYFHCRYSQLPLRTGELANSTIFSRREDFLDWLERFVVAAKQMTEDYIMLLEDDVTVCKPIHSPLLFDINGANTKEFLGKKMERYLQSRGVKANARNGRIFYGGCGGALFRRTFIIEHFADRQKVSDMLTACEPYREGRHLTFYSTDYWISVLTYCVGGTIGNYQGFSEQWQWNVWIRRHILNNIEVLHQDKRLYNKPLDTDEQKIIGVSLV
jgi:hypothetical protein